MLTEDPDMDYYMLRDILHRAWRLGDYRTARLALAKSDEFFSTHPEYKAGCFGANFYPRFPLH
jgi:hypothetical protein